MLSASEPQVAVVAVQSLAADCILYTPLLGLETLLVFGNAEYTGYNLLAAADYGAGSWYTSVDVAWVEAIVRALEVESPACFEAVKLVESCLAVGR